MKQTNLLAGIRLFGTFVVFLVFSYMFLSHTGVHAASLSQMSDILSTPKTSTAANHTITFRSTSGVSSGSIIVKFGNSISSVGTVNFSSTSLSYGGVTQTLDASPGPNTWGVDVSGSGKSVTFAFPVGGCVAPCAPISAGATVTIKIGTNVSGGSAQFTNGSSAGSQYASIITGQDVGLFAISLLSNPGISVGGTATITQQSSGTAFVAPAPAPAPAPSSQTQSPTPSQAPEPTPSQTTQTTTPETTTPTQSPTQPAPTETTPPTQSPTPPAPTEATTPTQSPTQTPTPEATTPTQSPTQPAPTPTQVEPAPPAESIVIPTAAAGSLEPIIVGATSVAGGGAQATILSSTFFGANGELTPVQVDVQPMSFDQSIDWTGCSAIRNLVIVGHVAYNLSAINHAPINAGDMSVEARRPVQLRIIYKPEDVAWQGLLEGTIHPLGYDPEDCMQTNIPFTLDTVTRTVTITVTPKTFYALTGSVRPGFVEKEAPLQTFEITPIHSDIANKDLGLDAGTLTDGQLLSGANTTIHMCIASNLFKKPVKRILLTVGSDKYTLQYDANRDCFAGTIHTARQGRQHIILTIIYIDDQIQIIEFDSVITSEFQANLLAFAMPFFDQIKALNEQVGKAVQQTQPILQTGAFAAVPVVGVANPSLVTNALNWYYYLNHFFSWLLSLLGLRKKRKPWGTVYNSITKNPVDLVIVRLFDKHTNRLIETQVTDKNGRFSFLAPPGEYYITATKNPLVFPSGLVKGTIDGDYTNIYRQESFTISGPDQAMTVSIPLDPPKVEKEVVAGRAGLIKQWQSFFGHNPLVPLLLGFIISELLTLYIPNTLNYTLLGLNGFFVLSQLILGTRAEKSWGLVFDSQSLEPVPLAAITMFDAKEGKLLRTRLSDYFGRFSFLTPPGEYMLAVMKDEYQFPAPKDAHIGKYHHLYFGDKFSVKKKKAFIKTNIPLLHRMPEEQPQSSSTTGAAAQPVSPESVQKPAEIMTPDRPSGSAAQ